MEIQKASLAALALAASACDREPEQCFERAQNETSNMVFQAVGEETKYYGDRASTCVTVDLYGTASFDEALPLEDIVCVGEDTRSGSWSYLPVYPTEYQTTDLDVCGLEYIDRYDCTVDCKEMIDWRK